MAEAIALSPDHIRAGLAPHGGSWTTISSLARTGSTNDDGRTVPLGDGAWSLVVADSQSRGRGRVGAGWHSPPGTAIHLSLVTHLALPVGCWPRASLVVGAAVAAELGRLTGTSPRLKWPNDLMILAQGSWRKLGGILCERYDLPDRPARWIAGVGINVNTPLSAFPEQLRPHVGTLAMTCERPPAREALVSGLANAVRREIAAWIVAGGQIDGRAVQRQLLFVGEEISVEVGDGGPDRRVHLRGLAADGALRVAPDRCAPAESESSIQPLQITAAHGDPPWHAAPRLAPAR